MKKTARFVSIILHPFVLFDIGIIFFLGEHFKWNIEKMLSWSALLGVANILLISFIKWGMKTRHFSNFDVSRRKQRFLLYQAVIFLTLLFYFFGKAIGISNIILEFSILFLILIVILGVVNVKVKASVHIASLTIISVAAGFYYGGFLIFLPLLIPILAWSRVYTKRHTKKEVLVGFLVGLIILTIAKFILK